MLIDIEFISVAPNGFNAGLVGIKLFSETLDMRIHRPVGANVIYPPDQLQQHIP